MPSYNSGNGGGTSDDEEDHTTLAQVLNSRLTPSQKTAAFSPNKSKLKTKRLLQANNARHASKYRTNAISKQAQKCVKSLSFHSALSDSAKKSTEHTRAMVRAEELLSNLVSDFPSFIKTMVRSHVSGCFWLGLPFQFCQLHMPKEDCMFSLRDQDRQSQEVKFIAKKAGLSGGWKCFSMTHNLLVDDVLVFHLIEPFVFKVYIIRAHDVIKVDGPVTLLDLSDHTKQNDRGRSTDVSSGITSASQKCDAGKNYNAEAVLPSSKVAKKMSSPKSTSEEKNGKHMIVEVPECCCGVQDPSAQIEDSVNFDMFMTRVDGFLVDLDPTLSEDIRRKYHELCYSQNSLLHADLLGLNFKLISGIIYEIVNISDAIRASTLTTSQYELLNWDKTLQAFEDLGMNVSFLRARLNLAFESEKKYVESQTRIGRIEEEIKTLEEKILKFKTVSKRFSSDKETLKLKLEKYELTFNEKVSAPW